jgi:ribose 5-phosphate isomerase A
MHFQPPDPEARFKQQAAEYAVDFVHSGMAVGLGTGSTAIYAIRLIAVLLAQGRLKDIAGFSTSSQVWQEAQCLGIRMMDEVMPRSIDITIDGADEVDPERNLIKGGGGALLREKIAAQASQRVVIVVDESKLSAQLGTHRALPVEVLPFGWHSQARFLEALGGRVVRRTQPDGSQFVTDSGNLILDCDFGQISNPAELALILGGRAGIVEHGLFIGLATDLIVGGEAGIRHFGKDKSSCSQ